MATTSSNKTKGTAKGAAAATAMAPAPAPAKAKVKVAAPAPGPKLELVTSAPKSKIPPAPLKKAAAATLTRKDLGIPMPSEGQTESVKVEAKAKAEAVSVKAEVPTSPRTSSAAIGTATPIPATKTNPVGRTRNYTPCSLPFGGDTAVRFIKGDQITATIRHNGQFSVRDVGGNLEIFDNIKSYYAAILRRPMPTSPGNFATLSDATVDDMANELGDIERASEWKAPQERTTSEIKRANRLADLAAKAGEAGEGGSGSGSGNGIDESDEEVGPTAIDSETGDIIYINEPKDEEQAMARAKRTMKTTVKRVSTAKGKAGKGKGTKAGTKHAARTKPAGEPRECPPCKCGCGEQVGKPTSTFLPGHDARFHGWVKKIKDGRMKLSELPNDAARKAVRAETH